DDWRTAPSGRKGPSGVSPVSSVSSRRAALSGSSPASISPLGMVHAPRSFLAKNGPPGCTSSTSTAGPALRRKSSRPALSFGMVGNPAGVSILYLHGALHPLHGRIGRARERARLQRRLGLGPQVLHEVAHGAAHAVELGLALRRRDH